MTNERSRLFQAFLEREELNFFEVKEFDDAVNTVMFRSYIQTSVGQVPLVVILDNSIYSIVRVTLGYDVVTPENEYAISRFIQEINSKYKSFKLYIESDDHSVYLDCVYMSTVESFEPELLYVLMSQLVEFIPEAHREVTALVGTEAVASDHECHCGHEHTHHCDCHK